MNKIGTKRMIAIYTRFSSTKQRVESLIAQERACREYAQRKGYEVVRVYSDEAESGTKSDRESFMRMISDSTKGIFNAIIVHKMDRFSRDRLQSLTFRKQLEDNGVELISATEDFGTGASKVMMETIMDGLNEFYIANLRSEIHKGLKENAYAGKNTGGKPPLGYITDPITKKYIIEPTEKEAVEMIFDLYLKNYTVAKIIRELNSRGYKTKKDKPFGTNSVRSIILNEKYTGKMIWNKSSKRDSRGKRNNSKTKDESEIIKVPNMIPAIISEETFQKAQQLMESRRKGHNPSSRALEVYMLSGLVKCGVCGYSYQGNRRKAKDKPIYTSYRCGGKKKNPSSCCSKEIRKSYLEQFVLEELERCLINNDTARDIKDRVNEYLDNLNGATRQKLSYVDEQLKQIEEKSQNIITAITQGFIQPEFKAKLDELTEEKERLLQEKEEHLKALEEPLTDEALIKEKLVKMKDFILTRNLPECRNIIKDLVKEVVVFNDHIELKLNVVSFIYSNIEVGKRIRTERKDLYVAHSAHYNYTFLKDLGYEYKREASTYGLPKM